MGNYYYLAIIEIVHAKSLHGYARAIRWMLNHELSVEPQKFGPQKATLLARELMAIHQNKKKWRVQNNRTENKEIAEEAYNEIANKYIRRNLNIEDL